MCSTVGARDEGSTDACDPTVVVVDDDPEVVSLVGLHLERLDADVLTETDPEAALARVREADVDCVVSDYEMPGMDGLALLSAVRDQEGEIPFVLFTGEGDDTLARQARDRGATYVRKSGEGGGVELVAEQVSERIERS